MKKIIMLSTGGTVASRLGANGLIPIMSGNQIIKHIPELKNLCQIECLNVLDVDSSNMQPEHWREIAKSAYSAILESDGVVITHGTDTMAYTSSMLSFILKNLNKPVVLTGSQIPIESPNTDAKCNILDAFKFAVTGTPGVYIVFDGKIIRGVRASKTNSESFDAFDSINETCFGYFLDGKVMINQPIHCPDGEFSLDDRFDERVALVKLIPGFMPRVLSALVDLGYKGIVIESYGAGGIPSLKRNLLPEIEKATSNGIAVVGTTQCTYGGANFSVYDVGINAVLSGLIPAKDMTSEAACTKLMWALANSTTRDNLLKIMQTNLVGEINT